MLYVRGKNGVRVDLVAGISSAVSEGTSESRNVLNE